MIERNGKLAKLEADTLPKGWAWTRIGDVSTDNQIGVIKPLREQNKDGNGIPYVKMNNVTMEGTIIYDGLAYVEATYEEVARYALQENDILFNTRNSVELVGKTGLVRNLPMRMIYNNNLMRIRTASGVDPAFLVYQMVSHNFREKMEKVKKATTNVAALYAKDVLPLPVRLPPLAEQKRIVAKIEELFTKLDAGVEALNKVRQELKRYRQAVLKHAFEGKLTEQWRKKNKDKIELASVLLERIAKEREKTGKGKKQKKILPLDTSELPELPDGWEWTSVGLLSKSMKNGIYKPRHFYCDDGVACLRMYNIFQGKIVWENIKRMNLSDEEIEEYGLMLGDILVNRVNSRELVGKAAPIPEGLEPCVFESKNIRLRVHHDFIRSKYVGFWFLLYAQGYFNQNAQQVVGMASISQVQLGSMPIPFTSPVEQESIVAEIERHFSVADHVEQAIEQGLKQSDRLRQSILKKAFEGKLVPQDPSDEPAEKLLERIKTEKEKLRSKQMDLKKTRTVKHKKM